MERLLAVSTRMHDDEVDVDETLVRELLAAQMPHLADHPLTKVEPWGTDHAIWRLGDDLVVRLPRIGWAAGQPIHEAEWLPRLAPHVPVAIPEPIAVGEPGAGIRFDGRSTAGSPATVRHRALRRSGHVRPRPRRGRPRPPERSDRRCAASPAIGRGHWREYDAATRWAIDRASHLIDADAATAVWEEALAAAPSDGPTVWVQGDLEGNCLVADGRLCGIVDWGSACVGDPAVDVQVVWSPLFSEERVVRSSTRSTSTTQAPPESGCGDQPGLHGAAVLPRHYPLIVERSWHKLEAVGVPRRTSP